MPKAKKVDSIAMAGDLGGLIGQALAEGIAKGLEGALDRVRAELAPLGTEMGTVLVSQLGAESDEDLGLRICGDDGCDRRAIARGLCRRHYARQIYQERKARSGTPATTTRRRRLIDDGAEVSEQHQKKVVAAVAPIVRRRKSDNDEKASAPLAPMPPPATVSVDSVARFLGVKVD